MTFALVCLSILIHGERTTDSRPVPLTSLMRATSCGAVVPTSRAKTCLQYWSSASNIAPKTSSQNLLAFRNTHRILKVSMFLQITQPAIYNSTNSTKILRPRAHESAVTRINHSRRSGNEDDRTIRHTIDLFHPGGVSVNPTFGSSTIIVVRVSSYIVATSRFWFIFIVLPDIFDRVCRTDDFRWTFLSLW